MVVLNCLSSSRVWLCALAVFADASIVRAGWPSLWRGLHHLATPGGGARHGSSLEWRTSVASLAISTATMVNVSFPTSKSVAASGAGAGVAIALPHGHLLAQFCRYGHVAARASLQRQGLSGPDGSRTSAGLAPTWRQHGFAAAALSGPCSNWSGRRQTVTSTAIVVLGWSCCWVPNNTPMDVASRSLAGQGEARDQEFDVLEECQGRAGHSRKNRHLALVQGGTEDLTEASNHGLAGFIHWLLPDLFGVCCLCTTMLAACSTHQGRSISCPCRTVCRTGTCAR